MVDISSTLPTVTITYPENNERDLLGNSTRMTFWLLRFYLVAYDPEHCDTFA